MAGRVTAVGVDGVVCESGGPCLLSASVPTQRAKLSTYAFLFVIFQKQKASFFSSCSCCFCFGLDDDGGVSERGNTDDDDQPITSERNTSNLPRLDSRSGS